MKLMAIRLDHPQLCQHSPGPREEVFSALSMSRKVVDITAYDRLSQVHIADVLVTVDALLNARKFLIDATIRG